MWKILLVEDIGATIEELLIVLSESFPGTRVDHASNRDAALDLIEQARKEGAPYDAAILDFKIPKSANTREEVNTDVCARLVERRDETFIVHVTAYVADVDVQNHMVQAHTTGGQGAALIDKHDIEWSEKLTNLLRRHLRSRDVREDLSMFQSAGGADSAAHAPAATFGSASGTQRLGALVHNIIEYWPDLDEDVRQDVRRVFVVHENPGRPVEIGLL